MGKRIVLAIFVCVVFVSGVVFFVVNQKNRFISPVSKKIQELREKPLEKYTFENLRKTRFEASEITIGENLKDEENFASYIFYYFDNGPSTGSGQGKRVSGLLNIPKQEGVHPIIVMFRGYVDREIYTTGEGSRRAGEVFAQNGFITLAPDFLGYGESASPSALSIEERFQTYTTALSLLSSLSNLNKSLESVGINLEANTEKVGIWGHSNGGHIALSVLSITGKPYPTVLWAPVSKPFPYSILYFTDEFDDHGKALRKVVADFEKDYDVESYSPPNYYEFIEVLMQIHQGGVDDAVPQRWSDQLAANLKELEKDVEYYVYPSSDHNLAPDGWSTAVNRSIEFYKRNL